MVQHFLQLILVTTIYNTINTHLTFHGNELNRDLVPKDIPHLKEQEKVHGPAHFTSVTPAVFPVRVRFRRCHGNTPSIVKD